jgi:hypothetical protein
MQALASRTAIHRGLGGVLRNRTDYVWQTRGSIAPHPVATRGRTHRLFGSLAAELALAVQLSRENVDKTR